MGLTHKQVNESRRYWRQVFDRVVTAQPYVLDRIVNLCSLIMHFVVTENWMVMNMTTKTRCPVAEGTLWN